MRISKARILLILSLITIDAFVIACSLISAYELRFFSIFAELFPPYKGIPQFLYYKQMLLMAIPLFLFVFYQNNFYKTYFVPFLDEIVRSGKSISTGIVFIVLTTFFYREYDFSRLVLIIFWVMSISMLVLYKQMLRIFSRYMFTRSDGREGVLIIGKNNRVIKNLLRRQPYVKTYFYPFDKNLLDSKIFGILHDRGINQVILTHQEWPKKEMLDFYDYCEKNNIDLKSIPDITEICRGEIVIDSSIGIPIFHLKSISLNGFNFYFKRIFDITISIIIVSLTWPVFTLIALIIKTSSKGEVLYTQKRMGYRGKIFKFIKFRTMVKNADKMLEQLKGKSERSGPVFKMSNDPRVTSIGKFLRKFSIDEFPQIINVLRGEMSLVGPRPQVLWEAAAYDDWSKRRLRILPGITGLWQVSGRANLSYEEMIELDIFYIENWSIGNDLEILLRTIPAIFSNKGAY